MVQQIIGDDVVSKVEKVPVVRIRPGNLKICFAADGSKVVLLCRYDSKFAWQSLYSGTGVFAVEGKIEFSEPMAAINAALRSGYKVYNAGSTSEFASMLPHIRGRNT